MWPHFICAVLLLVSAHQAAAQANQGYVRCSTSADCVNATYNNQSYAYCQIIFADRREEPQGSDFYPNKVCAFMPHAREKIVTGQLLWVLAGGGPPPCLGSL